MTEPIYDHEQLDVYRYSIEYVASSNRVAQSDGKGIDGSMDRWIDGSMDRWIDGSSTSTSTAMLSTSTRETSNKALDRSARSTPSDIKVFSARIRSMQPLRSGFLMQMLNKKLLLTLIGSVLVIGCTSRKPQPFTDRSIELMSVSGYAFARIDYYGQKRNHLELKPDEYETMRSLLRALVPIRESRAGKIADPEYSLSYQSGMDPTQVDVKIVDNELEYGVHDFVYIGGKADDFRKLLPTAPDPAE